MTTPIAPHLSAAVLSGGQLFLSGQLAFDDNGNIGGDAAAQTLRCLENIERVLADYNRSRLDIVKVTVWLTSRADFSAFNAAYAGFFGDHKPARSTVVCSLALEGALVEIEAIANRSP